MLRAASPWHRSAIRSPRRACSSRRGRRSEGRQEPVPESVHRPHRRVRGREHPGLPPPGGAPLDDTGVARKDRHRDLVGRSVAGDEGRRLVRLGDASGGAPSTQPRLPRGERLVMPDLFGGRRNARTHRPRDARDTPTHLGSEPRAMELAFLMFGVHCNSGSLALITRPDLWVRKP